MPRGMIAGPPMPQYGMPMNGQMPPMPPMMPPMPPMPPQPPQQQGAQPQQADPWAGGINPSLTALMPQGGAPSPAPYQPVAAPAGQTVLPMQVAAPVGQAAETIKPTPVVAPGQRSQPAPVTTPGWAWPPATAGIPIDPEALAGVPAQPGAPIPAELQELIAAEATLHPWRPTRSVEAIPWNSPQSPTPWPAVTPAQRQPWTPEEVERRLGALPPYWLQSAATPTYPPDSPRIEPETPSVLPMSLVAQEVTPTPIAQAPSQVVAPAQIDQTAAPAEQAVPPVPQTIPTDQTAPPGARPQTETGSTPPEVLPYDQAATPDVVPYYPTLAPAVSSQPVRTADALATPPPVDGSYSTRTGRHRRKIL